MAPGSPRRVSGHFQLLFQGASGLEAAQPGFEHGPKCRVLLWPRHLTSTTPVLKTLPSRPEDSGGC